MGILRKAFVLAAGAVLPLLAVWAEPSLSAQASYVQGLTSYREGDWVSATFFLRRALGDGSTDTDSVRFMLINSQMYAQDYRSALSDCDSFLSLFPDSPLVPYVQYQKGRALHFSGRNDDAVITLSDFCHENPGHDLYASALYWMGECFFDDYGFDTAKDLYGRVVSEYPLDEKAGDAEFKLALIGQREREEKLLYLLKVTGEESLSAREEYEKQLRRYQSEDVASLRRQLLAASQRIAELEQEVEGAGFSVPPASSAGAELYGGGTSAGEGLPSGRVLSAGDSPVSEKARSLAELKEKADLIERLLLQSLAEERH